MAKLTIAQVAKRYKFGLNQKSQRARVQKIYMDILLGKIKAEKELITTSRYTIEEADAVERYGDGADKAVFNNTKG